MKVELPHWTRVAIVMLLVGLPACSDRTQFLSIATAGTGGVYYPLGGAIASRLSALDATRRYTAEVTGGAVENVRRVERGEVEIAFAIGSTLYEAYTGGQDFPNPLTRLRVIAPLYPNLTHVLVGAGVNISSVADLRGRRVSVGAAGSGTEQLAQHLLAVYGLDYGAIQPRYLSFTESAAALADGAIDAAIVTVGYPASSVLEATTTGRARLLPVDSTAVSMLARTYPYYVPAVIPAGTYPGLDAAVPSFASMNWVIARDDLDDRIVQYLLEILTRDKDALRRAVDIAGQIDVPQLRSAPIPLHAAAQQWLELNVSSLLEPNP